jgi:hypothetical protein
MVYGGTFLRNFKFYAKTLTKLHDLTGPVKVLFVKKLNARTSYALAPFFKSHPFAGILTPKVFVPGCIRARLLSVGWQELA